MLSKERWKTTAGFFVIPLLGQLWEEKNYCERRNELSSWRPVALPNRHIHLYLFKLGSDVHVLLSIVMYILSGENITAVFTISQRRWDQNTTQVANRLNRARATYVPLLHVPPWNPPSGIRPLTTADMNKPTITGMYLSTTTLAYHQSPNNHWHESSNKHWHKSFNNHHMNPPTTTNCNIYFLPILLT